MAAVTTCSDFGAPKNKSQPLFPLFPHLFAMKWWDQMPWSSFRIWNSSAGIPSPPLALFIAMLLWKWKSLSRVRLFVTPWTIQFMESPGQNTGVGSLSLLQGIFPTQGSNPGLLHCRLIYYQLSHKASPRILGWVNYPFSSGSSQPRNQTGVSCIAGGFFTNWAMQEALQ